MEINDIITIIHSYYPKNYDFDEIDKSKHFAFKKLNDTCLSAYKNNTIWLKFLKEIKENSIVSVIDYSVNLTIDAKPSYICYFITEKSEYWLTLKISVIAPVYNLYYDNRSLDQNNRFIRCNPITEKEKDIFIKVKEGLITFFNDYTELGFFEGFHLMQNLGQIRLNRRKPYLDECVFGTYMSIHS